MEKEYEKNKRCFKKSEFYNVIVGNCSFLLESESLHGLRREVVLIFSFLNGKCALLSNIFLGIFASAFCMYIGEAVNLKYMKKDLESEIRQVFDEIWVKLSFKNGDNKESYIGNAQIILQYQDRIHRLYMEYADRKSHEHYVIYFLQAVLTLYKALYESEYMKNSNIVLFREFSENILKSVNGDLRNLYSLSVNNEEAMTIKKVFEDSINKITKYINDGNENANKYIETIKMIEPELEELYSAQIKLRGIE